MTPGHYPTGVIIRRYTGPNNFKEAELLQDYNESVESDILAKDNNSYKSMSNATKVKLDLYYVKINPYSKFQVNITKDGREKSGKLHICKGQ